MTGESLEPMGDLELEELIDIYKEQSHHLPSAAGMHSVLPESARLHTVSSVVPYLPSAQDR